MGLNPHEEYLIDRYFTSERIFIRSNFGAQLERAANNRDSRGRAFGPARAWNWLPDGIEPPNWPEAGQHPEPSLQEPDVEVFERIGGIDRRMRMLGRKSPESFEVLTAYYGDRGSRWASYSQDREVTGDEGQAPTRIMGVGPGSIAAVYRLTPAGHALLAFERDLTTRGRTSKQVKRDLRAQQKAEAEHRAALEHQVAARTADHEKARAAHASALESLAAAQKVRADLHALSMVSKVSASELAAANARLREGKTRLVAAMDVVEKTERSLRLVRDSHSYLALPAKLANPEPDGATMDALKAYKSALETHAAELKKHEEELKVWQEEKRDLERVSGDMSDSDSRLRPKPRAPKPPAEPSLAESRLPAPYYDVKQRDAPQGSDDDVLYVSMLVDKNDRAKGAFGRRQRFLDQARDQADGLLVVAWTQWMWTGRPGARAELDAILAERESAAAERVLGKRP